MTARHIDVTEAGDTIEKYALPDERWGHDFRIEDPAGTGVNASIWMDGERLTKVRGYSVKVGLNVATEVTVTFLASSVNREERSA